VAQLLLTYGPFYKNMTTYGPLPWNDIWNKRFTTYKMKKGEDKWVCHWNCYTIAIYYKSLQWDTCGRGFSATIVRLSTPVLVVQVGDHRPVFSLPCAICFRYVSNSFRLPFDFCFKKCTFRNVFWFPNIKCILVRNLSIWEIFLCRLIFTSSLQSLIPLVLYIFVKRCYACSNWNYLLQGRAINLVGGPLWEGCV